MISELVQALVITYDDTFHPLEAEAEVLLPKAFLDPIPPIAQHRPGPLGLSHV
jgi:hypothetical protein